MYILNVPSLTSQGNPLNQMEHKNCWKYVYDIHVQNVNCKRIVKKTSTVVKIFFDGT